MPSIASTRPAVLATLVLLCAALPSSAAAEEAKSAPPGPAAIGEPGSPALERPPKDAHQLERFKYWRARGEAALAKLEQARKEYREAKAAVSRMRRRKYPRGEARIRLQDELQLAREAYQVARHVVEVELPAEARQAGAPRHWLGRPI